MEEVKENVRAETTQPQQNDDVEAIRKVARHFGMEKEGEDHIMLGGDLEGFRAAVKAARMPKMVEPAAAPRIEVNIPRRTKTLVGFENNSRGEEQAYRAGQWLRARLFGDHDSLRWCQDHGVRVLTGVTGGQSALVPNELSDAIINLREQYGVARRYCQVVPMSTDTLAVPRRTAGVTAYFVARNTATSESDPTFENINLVARDVAALTRISRAYAADAVINLADFVAQEMAYAFAVKEDQCLFIGDGTSTYGGIRGIATLLTASAGSLVSSVSAATSGHDTIPEIDHDDLVAVIGTLPAFPGINPKWFCSKKFNSLVFDALKVAGGGNNFADLANGRPVMAYLGDEIVISQTLPANVTTDYTNTTMAIYGDLNLGVVFGDRQGIEIEVLNERYAEYRQVGIQAVERFDINVHGIGTTAAAGPIVALLGGTS